jgi:hypothetical protein
MPRKIAITTVRRLNDHGEQCNDRYTCQGIHILADRPGRRYVVLKRVTDPAEAAALAKFVGEDELLGYADDRLFEGL